MDAPLVGRDVRASDADRARAVAALRRHYAVGRLETHELEQRVAAAYSARWRGELRTLTRDMPFELPRIDAERVAHELARARRVVRTLPLEPPAVDRARVAEAVDRGQRALLRAHVIAWALLNVVLGAVWAASGEHAGLVGVVFLLSTTLVLCHAKGSRAISRRLQPGQARQRTLRPPGAPV